MRSQNDNPRDRAGIADDLILPGERVEPSRRLFLQLAGFGVASTMLAGCSRGPERRAIPHLSAPVGMVAGRAYWIATTCAGCTAACGVLAKCRDGRPIKLEGNPAHTLSKGGLCAVGQAEVLSLYDSHRLSDPRQGDTTLGWPELDTAVRGQLAAATRARGKVCVLTGTITSPSTREVIEKFLAAHPGAEHIVYDALSVSAMLEAHERTHGVRALPSYRFDRARVIVSLGADFLGTWISPVSHAADYAAGRRPEPVVAGESGAASEAGHMSRHIQLEARMSLTGAAADRRLRQAPWEVVPFLVDLCRALEKHVGGESRLGKGEENATARELAAELWAHPREGLVVCGANDVEAQMLTAYANHLLRNYGHTLSIGNPSHQCAGNDVALQGLKVELEAGKVNTLIVSGVNPAYDLPEDFAASLSRAGTLVVHAAEETETVGLADYAIPACHALECWDDSEPEAGRYSLTQPTVPPLRRGRTLRHVLAAWMGDARDDSALVRDHWRGVLAAQGGAAADVEARIDRALQQGYVEVGTVGGAGEPPFRVASVTRPAPAGPREGLGLVLYPTVGLRAGATAHNPWLQELPDPITKITWDNYASLSEAKAAELGVEEGDVVRVTAFETSVELPVVVQRGQHDEVVAIALGYGRKGTDRFSKVGPEWWEGKPTVHEGETVGVNAAPLLSFVNGSLRYSTSGARIEVVGRKVELAATQDHHSLTVPPHLAPKGGEVRHAVRTAGFAAYREDPVHALHAGHQVPAAELWPDDHAPKRHHWGMSVDLSRCNGCSACTISCQAENNVPVVGKDEVRRHREMHWLRVDRYFEGEGDAVTAAYQPMFCQQCDNAPCESVCPVLATVHSSEGLNQQVYNRCVGTRYCANTCPYKVRRFNWFNYPHEDRLQNHSLNPDVTVRTRGVMEKCTFCAQRIQEAKSEAAARGVVLADGDIQVACQQSCPTQAIVFGDLADPESRVSKLAAKNRSYRVLAEINVKPSVRYLARIRNVASEEANHGG